MNVLVTGGTGSLGGALRTRFLAEGVDRLICYSRDEVKQAEQARACPDPRMRWFLGDVRDTERLEEAFAGVDVVVHAAALKRVDATAYNPQELLKTNVQGTQNVIRAAVRTHVDRVLLISSDKAVEPANPYGVSKAMAESLAVASNASTWPRGTRVSVLRYGNVMGSRGSVIPLWRSVIAAGGTPRLTDRRMTRFWLTLPEAADLVVRVLSVMRGGEVFVPVLPSCWVEYVLQAMWDGPIEVSGLRPGGEKLHETLISAEEAPRTVAVDDRLWAVLPALHPWTDGPIREGEPFPAGAVYRSDLSGWRLTRDEIRKMLEGV